jgi:hypothetical protein
MTGYSQKFTAALLNQLDSAIVDAPHYDQEKIKKNSLLHDELLKNPSGHLYNYYLDLYNGYYIFNYDSAYTYARRLQRLAI